MTIGKYERMECLKPKKRTSILQNDCFEKDYCKYDSSIGRGFVNHIDDTCIIEFDSLKDLKMYDRISGELGHICHGAFDESDEPLLGFSGNDIHESVTYNKQFRRFQSSRCNPIVSLKRLPDSYLHVPRISLKGVKGLLKVGKSRGSTSLKRRRIEVSPKCSTRLSKAESGYISTYSEGSSSRQKKSGSKALDHMRGVDFFNTPECQAKPDSKLISISSRHTVCQRLAEHIDELGNEFVDVVNCDSDRGSLKIEGGTHEPVDLTESFKDELDTDESTQLKSRPCFYKLPSLTSKYGPRRMLISPRGKADSTKLKFEPACQHSHKQPSCISGNGPAPQPEANEDVSDATNLNLVSAFQPSFKTPSHIPTRVPVNVLDPFRDHAKTKNAKLMAACQYSPRPPSSIPYLIKCGLQNSARQCKDLNLCANANKKFAMHFVLTVGRGRKLPLKVVESLQNDHPCVISAASAYIAASAVENHPTTILVPARQGVVEEVLPESRSNFLKEMVEETRKIERKKWLAGASSVHVSIAQNEAEIIAEKVIAARQKKFVMTRRFTVIDRGIEKGLLHSEKSRDYDKNGVAAAKRAASISPYNAKTGNEDIPPRKKYLIDTVSNNFDGCGETGPKMLTSLGPSHLISEISTSPNSSKLPGTMVNSVGKLTGSGSAPRIPTPLDGNRSMTEWLSDSALKNPMVPQGSQKKSSSCSSGPLPTSSSSSVHSKAINMRKPAFSEPVRVSVNTSLQTTFQGTRMKAACSPRRLFIKTSSSISPDECVLNRIAAKHSKVLPSPSLFLEGSEKGDSSSTESARVNLISISPKENIRTRNTSSQQPVIVPLLSASCIAFPGENKTVQKSNVPVNGIHFPQSHGEGIRANADEPAFKEHATSRTEDTANMGSNAVHQQIDSQHVKTDLSPKSIPVIVHPKYLQKLKFKPNEETSTKPATSVTPEEVASPGNNLGESTDSENSKKPISSPNSPLGIQNSVTDQDSDQPAEQTVVCPASVNPHSDVPDDPDVILVPTESVSIDLTECDGDDFIDLTFEEGGSSWQETEKRVEPTVESQDDSHVIVRDPIPNWGVICTSLPELGFVKVEKRSEELRLYDTAIVSEPLEFANIQELKRFLNSHLANLSYPYRNRIALDWIVVTAGFLRIKTVPPTNPQFWLNPKTAKQTQKYMRSFATTMNVPQTKKAFIVPTTVPQGAPVHVPRSATVHVPRSAPVHVPRSPNCNGAKKVLSVVRLATVQGASASLPKNSKLIVGSGKLSSLSGGQCLMMDSPAIVDQHEKQSESTLPKFCDTVTYVSTTKSAGRTSGAVIIESSQVSSTSAVISAPKVPKTSLLFAQNKQMLKPYISANLTVGSSSSVMIPAKAVLRTIDPGSTPIKRDTVSSHSTTTSSKTLSASSGQISLLTNTAVTAAGSSASASKTQVMVPTTSVATQTGAVIVPTIVASSSSKSFVVPPSLNSIRMSSSTIPGSSSFIQRISSPISPSGNSRLIAPRQPLLILPKGFKASVPVLTSTPCQTTCGKNAPFISVLPSK